MKSELQKEIDEWLGKEDNPTPSPKSPALDLPESSFFGIVDNMVKLNWQHRLNLPMNVPTSISPVQFAMEFCTVKCDIGRRTGKTEYVKHRADEYSLVIVHNQMLTKVYPDNVIVKNIQEISRRHDMFYGANKPRVVYIEEPQMVFRTVPQHELYYRLMDGSYDQTFILLGA